MKVRQCNLQAEGSMCHMLEKSEDTLASLGWTQAS